MADTEHLSLLITLPVNPHSFTTDLHRCTLSYGPGDLGSEQLKTSAWWRPRTTALPSRKTLLVLSTHSLRSRRTERVQGAPDPASLQLPVLQVPQGGSCLSLVCPAWRTLGWLRAVHQSCPSAHYSSCWKRNRNTSSVPDRCGAEPTLCSSGSNEHGAGRKFSPSWSLPSSGVETLQSEERESPRCWPV